MQDVVLKPKAAGMGSDHGVQGRDVQMPARVQAGIDVLAEADRYARLTGSDRWDFAVEIGQLRELGLSANDLRLLVRTQLVEHATEITLPGQDGRQFQRTGNLTFTKRSCFVLANSLNGPPFATRPLEVTTPPAGFGSTNSRSRRDGDVIPRWDTETRVLWLAGHVVKQFKWQAVNQETLLAAFEEEGWPSRIDDPLPPQPEQDCKRRLSDTIKCLNRKQKNRLLHFRGDGTGEGVIWERQDRTNSHGLEESDR